MISKKFALRKIKFQIIIAFCSMHNVSSCILYSICVTNIKELWEYFMVKWNYTLKPQKFKKEIKYLTKFRIKDFFRASFHWNYTLDYFDIFFWRYILLFSKKFLCIPHAAGKTFPNYTKNFVNDTRIKYVIRILMQKIFF